MTGISRERIPFLLASLMLAIPCFWQPHLVNGDLGSHAYNAWLSLLAERGEAPGIYLVPMWSNVLFDLILANLMRVLSPDLSQKFAAWIAVLSFTWGAFSLINTLSQRRPWRVFPLLCMLAYGVVFHLGFLNFYMALGFVFAAAAIVLNPQLSFSAARVFRISVLLALAIAAHFAAVVWGGFTVGFLLFAAGLKPYRRLLLLLCAFLALAAASLLFRHFAGAQYQGSGTECFGFLQLWIFDKRYLLFSISAAAYASYVLFVRHLDEPDLPGSLASPPPLLYFLCCALVLAAPSRLAIPGIPQSFSVLPERLSLPAAVALLAWLNSTELPRRSVLTQSVLAFLFFSTLFFDHWRFSRVEESLHRAVRNHKPNINAISRFRFTTRVDVAEHMIDRACIGYCWSYLNYEPASGQFRVRASASSPVVVDSTERLVQLLELRARLTPSTNPLLAFTPESGDPFSMRSQPLAAGDRLPEPLLLQPPSAFPRNK